MTAWVKIVLMEINVHQVVTVKTLGCLTLQQISFFKLQRERFHLSKMYKPFFQQTLSGRRLMSN